MITQPYPSFIDPKVGGRAKPVSNGTIFIGEDKKDQIQFPEKVYYTDSKGTEIEMSQPIYLNSAGVTVSSKNSSTVVRPYTKSASYSILIKNSNDNPVYINDSVSGFATEGWVESGVAEITATGSTTPRSLADRIADLLSVKDYGAIGDGVADDTAAFQAAIDANSTIYLPSGTYSLGNINVTSDIVILGDMASITPNKTGTVFNVNHSGTFEVYGTLFKLGSTHTTSNDICIDMYNLSRVVIKGCSFTQGGYQTRNENCNNVIITENFFDQSKLWPMFILGGENVFITNNTSNRSTYDGIKVAGFQDGRFSSIKELVITGNICQGNGRDGLDMAVNALEYATISNNIFTNNTLQGLDLKTLNNPDNDLPQYMRRATITGNVIDVTGEQGINIQCGDPSASSITDIIVANNYVLGTGVSGGAGVRFQNIDDSSIQNNIFKQVNQGVRLIDQCRFNIVEGNKLFDSKRAVVMETQVKGIPSNTKVFSNFAQNHLGNFALLSSGNANEFFNNRIEMADPSANYTLFAENITDGGSTATSTRWFNNIVGISQTVPIGWRTVVGDEWEVSQPSLGLPSRWVSITQTPSSTNSSSVGVAQVGISTNEGTPVGSVTPLYAGETLFDTTDSKWYKANGVGNTNWA